MTHRAHAHLYRHVLCFPVAKDVVATGAKITSLIGQLEAVFGRRTGLVTHDAHGTIGRRHVYYVLLPDLFVASGRLAGLSRLQNYFLRFNRRNQGRRPNQKRCQ